jgi:hypothetical protein
LTDFGDIDAIDNNGVFKKPLEIPIFKHCD